MEVLKTRSYFKIAGYHLELFNHGAPNCPDILLNKKKASRAKPQAWSKDIEGQEHWFYNYPGACTEAVFLGKEIPTIDQWMEIFTSVKGSDLEKSRTLNMPMVGYVDADNGRLDDYYYAFVWSSSPTNDGDDVARHAILSRYGDDGGFRYFNSRARGLSLRFFADKK